MGLSARTERRLAVLLGDTLGEPDPEISRAAAAWMSAYLDRAPPLPALGMRVALLLVLWLPLLVVGRPCGADRLSPEERARYLSRWTGARIYWVRELFYLVKAVALMGWGIQPAVRARLGLPPAAHPQRLEPGR